MPFNLPVGIIYHRSLHRFLIPSLVHLRAIRYQAHDALLNQDDLDEARKWYISFDGSSLPRGQTSYSRSSGPGGQHVNKTESKATSVWPMGELSRGLPKMMRSALRSSRNANTDENREKLIGEIHRIYREQIPAATDAKKVKKHETIERAFHQNRLNAKKQQSSKKASRKRGGSRD